jgi:hypothetical protein
MITGRKGADSWTYSRRYWIISLAWRERDLTGQTRPERTVVSTQAVSPNSSLIAPAKPSCETARAKRMACP